MPTVGPVDRDAGFTLIETIVSVFVIGVVMSALTSFYVATVSFTTQQGGVQVATQLAADAVSRVRAMKGSDLLTDRDEASAQTQWNSPVAGVGSYLADMEPAWDESAMFPAGRTAALPTVPGSAVLNGVAYGQHWYVGRCWQTLAGGACGKAQPVAAVPFFRVVVGVTWTDRRCAASTCSYVTSTLVSSVSAEPIFNLNETARRPVVRNPGNQTGEPNSAVNLQLTASGNAPPLTWFFTGLPPGVTNAGGLLTGTLPATVGTYTVIASVKDSFGLVGTAAFTWTVHSRTYPETVLRDQPWAYYRLEEAPTSSAPGTVADSSGNNRPGTLAGTTSGPATWWPFDETTGSVAADISGAANPGTLTNAPTWGTGISGSALSFNGSNTSVRGTRAAVHTNRDFTVTAWAYLAAGGGSNKAVVSQSGTTSYGYALRYQASSNKWAFALPNADATDPGNTQALSASAAVTGRWVHLAGVFNASASTATLYVDGVASGSVARSAGWDAQGPIQVGQEQWNGTQMNVFNGRIDDVRAYQRVLSAAEVAKQSGDPARLRWDFSEGTGTTTADLAGGDHTGTLGSAIGWAGASNGHTGNGATFAADAANGYVGTARSAVHTDRSFTVSAWVYLTGAGTYRTAVSQSGSVVSGFYLQFDPGSGKWRFTMPKADSVVGAGDLIASTAAAATNAWVHLAGVYDAAAQTIGLYVDGVSQGTVARTTSWDAPGATEAGRGRYNGAPVDPWNGRLDSVRLYQRALSATEVAAVQAESVPAPVPPADMTAGLPGALRGAEKDSTGMGFGSYSNGHSNASLTSPMGYTTELWFRAAGTRGGVLIGFYVNKTGAGGARDRQVYLDNGGRLTFGVYPSASPVTVRSPATYNDGLWHHMAASFGPAGLRLHVDGALVVSNAAVTTAGNFTGYWRWGGGDTTLWPNRPADDYFTGTIDEVAVYQTQLTDQQIVAHYQAVDAP